jgi:hypothetical protein
MGSDESSGSGLDIKDTGSKEEKVSPRLEIDLEAVLAPDVMEGA